MDVLPKQILHHHVPVIKAILNMKSNTEYLVYSAKRSLECAINLVHVNLCTPQHLLQWALQEMVLLVFLICLHADFKKYSIEDAERCLKCSPKTVTGHYQAPEVEFIFLWLFYLKYQQKMGQTEFFTNTQFCNRDNRQTFTVLHPAFYPYYSNCILEGPVVHQTKKHSGSALYLLYTWRFH